ncbi:hypothetical protein [Clostridium tarantellae]|uniref:Uncharacterized protein n=1 Tax=Clostridium tarantellae TaxID=39493 RepID=A0A6I1MNL6_9CLOT|nr:hypothetical protein [Clostridium tarantellae]MPQ44353.1 hypothetical protein [Clostridium tarantellae]
MRLSKGEIALEKKRITKNSSKRTVVAYLKRKYKFVAKQFGNKYSCEILDYVNVDGRDFTAYIIFKDSRIKEIELRSLDNAEVQLKDYEEWVNSLIDNPYKTEKNKRFYKYKWGEIIVTTSRAHENDKGCIIITINYNDRKFLWW